MKAFSEKADFVLRTLNLPSPITWNAFTLITEIPQSDAVLVLLENKDMIDYSESDIWITEKGKQFITSTSFVEQRDTHNEKFDN